MEKRVKSGTVLKQRRVNCVSQVLEHRPDFSLTLFIFNESSWCHSAGAWSEVVQSLPFSVCSPLLSHHPFPVRSFTAWSYTGFTAATQRHATCHCHRTPRITNTHIVLHKVQMWEHFVSKITCTSFHSSVKYIHYTFYSAFMWSSSRKCRILLNILIWHYMHFQQQLFAYWQLII